MIKQVGVITVTELIETASKLVPIDRLNELTTLLKEVKSIDELKVVIAVFTKLGLEGVQTVIETPDDKLKSGLKNIRGVPPCFKTDDGKTNPLFTIRANNGVYEITLITGAGEEVSKVTGLIFFVGQKFSGNEISKLGAAIKSKYINCNNAVTYYGDDNRLDSLLRVQESFNTLTRRSRAR